MTSAHVSYASILARLHVSHQRLRRPRPQRRQRLAHRWLPGIAYREQDTWQQTATTPQPHRTSRVRAHIAHCAHVTCAKSATTMLVASCSTLTTAIGGGVCRARAEMEHTTSITRTGATKPIQPTAAGSLAQGTALIPLPPSHAAYQLHHLFLQLCHRFV